jgi:signal transduction histidine kinase
MLTNIDLEKMNHLMETNKDAKEIITQLLKNHDAAVATIAHEIRNPMTVLYSSMQLMSSLYAETAKGSCVWEECMDGARHMCDLLDDLTELNNGNQLNRASFPLGHVLRNSAVLFAMSLNFEKSKIEMTSSIDKNIKRFNGDRTKLEEVFLNILTNAKDALADCKYAPRLQFRAKKLDDNAKITAVVFQRKLLISFMNHSLQQKKTVPALVSQFPKESLKHIMERSTLHLTIPMEQSYRSHFLRKISDSFNIRFR